MVELLACFWTIAGPVGFGEPYFSPWDLRLRVEAAARAGYRGIGLMHSDLMRALGEYGEDGVRAILADNGIHHLELEALGDWWTQGKQREASDEVRRQLLRAAEALGARHLKAYSDVAPRTATDIDLLRREFGDLARQARDAGTMAVLEPIGCSSVRDLTTALAVLADAAGCGGGLLLDAWHIVRGGIPLVEVAALPRPAVGCVELDDGRAVAEDDYLTETLHRRKLCGEGAFDLAGVISAARSTGYDGPWGVEIISDAQQALTLDEAARRSFQTTMDVFDSLP